MTRADRIALLLSLFAVGISILVSARIFERMPHLEDEFAYVWQAEVIAEGHLTIPSPPHPKSFLVPFVVDENGRRFGKYPLGWPVVLSFGVQLGMRHLVNSLLAGLAVWLTYRLGKKALGETVGLLAALLTLSSPFFLMNSGSLLSHPWGLFLSAAFVVAWLDSTSERDSPPKWLTTLTAGLTLGVLALSRPFTMLGIALPFSIHGLVLLVRADRSIRRRVLYIGVIALVISSIHFLWQYALTGDALLNPYTLWWDYDKVGFGPGHGVTEVGHNLSLARINTKFSLQVGYS
ncbi:MAG: glycosyltransferase family 39 protein, partial [Anaerolineales bacterium]